MNFNELLQEVYALTARPDLEVETKAAVRAATLKAHQSDFYRNDLYEVPIQFESSQILQAFEPRLLIPRYRKIKYLRHYDATGLGAPGEFFSIIEPEEVLDGYKLQRNNVAYEAGELIQIRGAVAFTYVLFGCYVNPQLTEANYRSWVANDYPYAIIYSAAATVFRATGLAEEAEAMNKEATVYMMELKMNALAKVGE